MPFQNRTAFLTMKWSRVSLPDPGSAIGSQDYCGICLECCCIKESVLSRLKTDSAEILNSGLLVIECFCSASVVESLDAATGKDDIACNGMGGGGHLKDINFSEIRSISINVGDFFICKSKNPTKFVAHQSLYRVLLAFPWGEIESRVPTGSRLKAGAIDFRDGIGALLHSHITSLSTQLAHVTDNEGASVRRATLELVIAAISKETELRKNNLSHRYLKQLKDFALKNLSNENLTPTYIAGANKMTPRYVHLLFSQTGMSVSEWIRSERLERCREDLLKPKYQGANVAEIAYAWGFKDPTNFSRAFKAHFGISPNNFRKYHQSKKNV